MATSSYRDSGLCAAQLREPQTRARPESSGGVQGARCCQQFVAHSHRWARAETKKKESRYMNKNINIISDDDGDIL